MTISSAENPNVFKMSFYFQKVLLVVPTLTRTQCNDPRNNRVRMDTRGSAIPFSAVILGSRSAEDARKEFAVSTEGGFNQ